MAESSSTEIFRDLSGEDQNPETTSIESICMNCYQNGTTRLLLTRIPFYKEVVLSSFHCEHCGFRNNDIQSASETQLTGIRITLTVTKPSDLNRKVVKSDFSSIEIPEVNLEIPSRSQKGEITTIEGIIDRTITSLNQDQENRKKDHPEVAEKITEFIASLEKLKLVEKHFTLIIEDISGNSFVENPYAPQTDPNSKTSSFTRTKEQDEILGIYPEAVIEKPEKEKNEDHLLKPIPEDSWPLEELCGEVLQFQTNCPECKAPCETNMKLTNIPHFKEVVIMATICEKCGNKTNEVKSGGGVEERGVKFEVQIRTKEDLNRDVLKSDTCCMSVPELDCSVGPSALGGRFTTVEGLMIAMKDQLHEHSFIFHDSGSEETKAKFDKFMNEIDNVLTLKTSATLVLDDPAGNSYIQSLLDDEPDEGLVVTRYIRSFEQNEELGLNDIKTENYEN